MIKLNGIYKLKKIKGSNFNDNADYQVIAIGKTEGVDIVCCKNLETNEQFYFSSKFLIDPETPKDIYAPIKIKQEKGEVCAKK